MGQGRAGGLQQKMQILRPVRKEQTRHVRQTQLPINKRCRADLESVQSLSAVLRPDATCQFMYRNNWVAFCRPVTAASCGNESRNKQAEQHHLHSP